MEPLHTMPSLRHGVSHEPRTIVGQMIPATLETLRSILHGSNAVLNHNSDSLFSYSGLSFFRVAFVRVALSDSLILA
ncbi:hypothetical protein T01_5298 [Trichinella spiralis]|uniref:Uncharacterized protein n=1 Tax=Trichinella spiralis TaxID=6334 RepID=A0A0V1APB2_TRISP|nr:hypothetical protein T01_5298 [Trichinella spiralis]